MTKSRSANQQAKAFEANSAPLDERLIVGLSKIGMALKSKAWSRAPGDGVSPTQAQILALLRNRADGLRLSAIAEGLGITMPTASEAVGSLVDKNLVRRGRDPEDGRAVRFSLTARGGETAARISDWPDFMLQAIAALDAHEQAVMLRAFVKMIRTMQETGDIPVQRMCVTCNYFRPNAHPEDSQRPHHCAFADAPFGDSLIRLDCADQQPASIEQANHQWDRWLAGATHSQPT